MLALQRLEEKMGNMILKILIGLLTKLVTERFIARVTVRLLYFLAIQTPFAVDDKLVDEIATGLGVTDYK